ncbi:MAG TPA: creatininase family protein [Vicinamibacteria bacterium]|nr:creatininase family protein [Vicinamibacteria bacterium]
MTRTLACLFAAALLARGATAADLPARWDELTASDWPRAMEESAATIVLPIGILEKHGPHAPMGSDLIHVREWAARATKREYAVVFPDFFYGQINEARHQPGTFSLPPRVVWDLLEAACDEMGRNGFKKILIVNGHGGNPELIRYFMQTQLGRRRDYVVYFFTPESDPAVDAKVQAMRKSDPAGDMHAGERETSTLLYLRPDLMRMDRATSESGADQKRLALPDLYTPIWWYAGFPNHYAGEGDKATADLGRVLTEARVDALVQALRTVKADQNAPALQKEFFDRVKQ